MDAELRVVSRQGVMVAPLPEATVQEAVWDLAPENDKMKIGIHPTAPNANAILPQENEIQLWIDGALRHWVIPKDASGNANQMVWECDGLFTYFFDRFVLEDDLVFTGAEQIAVGAYLVTYAQDAVQGTNPNLYIGIAGYTNSGIPMTRTYTSDRKGSIVEGLRDLSTVEDGFEQSIEIFGNGTRLWTPHFPQRGSFKAAFGLEYGRNIVDFTWKRVGSKIATKIDATGGTAEIDPFDPLVGREKQNYIYEDTAASTKYGVRITVLPSGAKSDLDWLERRAKRAVATRKDAITVTSVTCRSGGIYPDLMANLWPGDEVNVRIDQGAIQVVGPHRIKTKTWIPEGNRIKFDFTSVVD